MSLFAAVVLTGTGCKDTTAGNPFAGGSAAGESSSAGKDKPGRQTPVREAKTVPGVCRAIIQKAKPTGFPPDIKYEEKGGTGAFSGPSSTCSGDSYDNSSFELSASVSVHPGDTGSDGKKRTGSEAVAEHLDMLRTLNEDGGGGEVIDLPPADGAYIGPQALGTSVEVYQANVMVRVLYRDEAKSREQLLTDVKAMALAVLGEVKFE